MREYDTVVQKAIEAEDEYESHFNNNQDVGIQYMKMDDDACSRLREIATRFTTKPIPNEEGIEQEFWLHRTPYALEDHG